MIYLVIFLHVSREFVNSSGNYKVVDALEESLKHLRYEKYHCTFFTVFIESPLKFKRAQFHKLKELAMAYVNIKRFFIPVLRYSAVKK